VAALRPPGRARGVRSATDGRWWLAQTGRRGDLGAGLASLSLDGGLEEFRGVCRSRASSSAIRSCARSSSARACASSLRSDTTSTASTSAEGGP
jgi:hypothetical protein